MTRACERGQLNVCVWLYKNGAAEDITKRDKIFGRSPMWWACKNGHVSVCMWLSQVGADEDRLRADNYDDTPEMAAERNGHKLAMKWLEDRRYQRTTPQAATTDAPPAPEATAAAAPRPKAPPLPPRAAAGSGGTR